MFDHIMAGVEIISGKIGHFAIYVSLVFLLFTFHANISVRAIVLDLVSS